jgi:hypothetical protein
MSKEGKWRSFPQVPHVLQYVSNGNYYARVKVASKLIRESLKTSVWSIAQLRLNDFLKEHQEARITVVCPTFGDAAEQFKLELKGTSGIKPQSKQYRLYCLQKIEKTWPALWKLRLDEVTAQDCREWSARFNKEIASHYYNNTIGTLKLVFEVGIRANKETGVKNLRTQR